ncbi:MAG: hypothetical protein ACETWM_07960 [Candidatus Lokiarchaeia archaeon]
MKSRKGLVLVLLVLTLSLTTATLINQSDLTAPLIINNTHQQSTPKSLNIKWGPEKLTPTNTTLNQLHPSVCCFPNGSGFVVAWESEQTGDSDIYVKLFDSSGNNLTDDILVNTYTTDLQFRPSVCCHSDGSFVVAWVGNGAEDDVGIYAKIFNSTGQNQTDDIFVNTNTYHNQGDPSVCCLPDGSFVVAWVSLHTDDSEIYFKLFNSTGYNTTDEIRVNTYTTGSQYFPCVSCFSNGTFIVAWSGEGQEDSFGVYTKFFNSTGHNQTDDIQVNTNTAGLQHLPSVCCFPNDTGFVIAWHSKHTENWEVYCKLFNSTGVSTTDEIRVNTNITGTQLHTSVCCRPDGSFVVAWEGAQTGDYDIYAKIFDSSANSLTDEIRVNDYTTYHQTWSSVCCFPDGSFIVVWESQNQDLSGSGVYFRIGQLETDLSPSLLMILLLAQSGTGASVPLLVGGILAVALVAGVIGYWWLKRSGVAEHPEGGPPKTPKTPKAPEPPPKAPKPVKAPKKWEPE